MFETKYNFKVVFEVTLWFFSNGFIFDDWEPI